MSKELRDAKRMTKTELAKQNRKMRRLLRKAGPWVGRQGGDFPWPKVAESIRNEVAEFLGIRL
jgi:hypothetical protein